MPSNHGTSSDLSDAQRALLQSAVQDGYFKIPRKISTVELAEKHNMSSQEASEELRRSLDVVVRDADLGE